MGSPFDDAIPVDIRYCVECGYLPMALWIASELHAEMGAELAITVSPGHTGVLHVQAGGEQIYDNIEAGQSGIDFDHLMMLKMAVREKVGH